MNDSSLKLIGIPISLCQLERESGFSCLTSRSVRIALPSLVEILEVSLITRQES